MGLMAIHLLLLAVNTVSPGLGSRVKIYSDCLGALSHVVELPHVAFLLDAGIQIS